MKYTNPILFAFIIFGFALSVAAQTTGRKAAAQNSAPANNQAAKSSPAYAELLVEKTELEAQLEDFLGDYKEDFPKIKELRFQLDLIQKAANRFLAVSASDAPKLTLALGKLTLRKIALETNLWNLQKQYKDDYPEVKRLKRKVEVFDRAIREILPQAN